MHQLVYQSAAVAGVNRQTVMNVLETARARNTELLVTGVLLFRKNRFLQVLEGDKDVITSLYDVIKLDPRHQDLQLLLLDAVDERVFPDWSMGMCVVDDNSYAHEPGYFNLLTEVPLMVRTMKATKKLQLLLHAFVVS